MNRGCHSVFHELLLVLSCLLATVSQRHLRQHQPSFRVEWVWLVPREVIFATSGFVLLQGTTTSPHYTKELLGVSLISLFAIVLQEGPGRLWLIFLFFRTFFFNFLKDVMLEAGAWFSLAYSLQF